MIERGHHLMRQGNVRDRIPSIEGNLEDTMKGDQDRDLAQQDGSAREYKNHMKLNRNNNNDKIESTFQLHFLTSCD
jgi:hypothetical protein